MSWLYKRKGSTKFWLGWRAGGKVCQKTTGTADRKEALKQLAGVRALHESQRAGALSLAVYESLTGIIAPKVTLKAALADWLTECEGSTSPGTLSRYATVAAAFEAHLGGGKDALVGEVTPSHIRTFLGQRRATRGASTLNLERKILQVFFVREVKSGAIKSSPVAQVSLLKQNRDEAGRKRAFTMDELRLISQKAPDEFWSYAICAGFYTGQRLGDIVSLNWGSVDLEQGVLRLTQGKTNRAVMIPLRPALRAILASLRAKSGKVKPSDAVFPEHAERYVNAGRKVRRVALEK